LIDGNAEFGFQWRDIFADYVIDIGILQNIGDRFALLRVGIECGVGHVSDLEYEAFGLVIARRYAGNALRSAKYGFDHLRWDKSAGLPR